MARRNSVGGDVDPRSGQALVLRDAPRLDGRQHPVRQAQPLVKYGTHFGYPYCHEGDIRTRNTPWATSATSHSPALNVGPHMARRDEVCTGNNFPAEYKNNIFLSEHGGWNQFMHTAPGSSASRPTRMARTSRRSRSPGVGSRTTSTGAARPMWRSTQWMDRSWSRMTRRRDLSDLVRRQATGTAAK